MYKTMKSSTKARRKQQAKDGILPGQMTPNVYWATYKSFAQWYFWKLKQTNGYCELCRANGIKQKMVLASWSPWSVCPER